MYSEWRGLRHGCMGDGQTNSIEIRNEIAVICISCRKEMQRYGSCQVPCLPLYFVARNNGVPIQKYGAGFCSIS